ncbi:GGDEF domain-containing protein [Deinococcus roseus]|uniref:GGDEF domain-containing protein n=1 Tax=Deinococcus roseus TaxID=392414 RepID=A0ABQ2CYB6_9DEIO|nr:GGDEF domain-containing protein [Deinococcus roseus]GGJ32562.1 hypothetical protein GCM10008938_18450 [Deinococcus roseus]
MTEFHSLLDPLTGLLSRFALQGHWASLKGAQVAWLDLDGFAHVNLDHGHAAGDQLLQGLARRLKACVREDEKLYRTVGDKFMVVFPRDSASDVLKLRVRELRALFDEPFDFPAGPDGVYFATAGIVTTSIADESFEVFLEKMRVLMRQNKARGKHQVLFS